MARVCQRTFLLVVALNPGLVKMFATIVLLFAICYLPMYVFLLIQDHKEDIMQNEYIKLIFLSAFFVGMSNCIYNPMIYCYMNSKFRNGFKSVLRFLPCVHYKPAEQWHGYARSTLRTYAANAAPAASPIKVVLKQNGGGDVTTELCHPPNWNNYHSINGNSTARL
ncbi:Tachykinin-like peptides receptor 99D [Holothuria leucospilota]|uniref:Tachykinin-like peptides receptor 99D n=1 Tax=Holothuria leucospilota TaxID=206669 RepID=A0A9Q0YHY6_HOLLE|nr:Tachykinin-like peptides receptor 99D [Holothuria leucospilota]